MWFHCWHYWQRNFLLETLKTGLWSVKRLGNIIIVIRGNPDQGKAPHESLIASLPYTLLQVSTASKPGPECEGVAVLPVHTFSASRVPSAGR